MDNQPQYPVSMNDHDLLIRVDQKLSQVSLDVKDLKDGLNGRVAVLEAKIITYDQLLAEYPPNKLVQQVNDNARWISDFKLTWRFVIILTIGVSSIITFLLTTVGNVLHLAGFWGR